MRARLIVNPASGADRAPSYLPMINDRLRTVFDELDITLTVDAADAERTAARAVGEACDALFVAGGDGTLNAVLRGALSAGDLRIPIGVIPFGTGNDFAKALGLGENPEEALAALVDCRVLDVDIGIVNDRPFVNISAGGFIADVSDSVTDSLKDLAGKLAYLIAGARALLGREPFSARLRVEADGRGVPACDESLELQLFAVCNARMIGGGHPIAPDAMIDDGLFDVVLVPRMPLLDFIGVLQHIAAGEYEGSAVRIFRASSFDLTFSRRVRVNTDGEVLETDVCRYRVKPRGGRFFCGPSAYASAQPFRLS